jgi:site-specific recombinase XerD
MEKVLMNEDRRSPNVSEKPINVQVVEPFIKAWISHHFRHLAACEPIDNGVSPEVVEESLGHSDIKSILVYSPDSRAKNFRKRSEALTKVEDGPF